MHADLTDRVRALIELPSPETAVEVLRAADRAPDDARRLAILELDEHLRARPETRSRDVVATLIALRRVGLSS